MPVVYQSTATCPLAAQRADRGFSLTELLVVVAIIGLLAALLVPSIRSGMEQSQRAACLGNLRQLGMALEAYAGDHDQVGPFDARDSVNNNSDVSLWRFKGQYVMFGLLVPYIDAEYALRTPKVLICPGSARKQELTDSWDATSYWINPQVCSNSEYGRLLLVPRERVAILDSCVWFQPGAFGPKYDNHRATGLNAYHLNGTASWIPISKTITLEPWNWAQLDSL